MNYAIAAGGGGGGDVGMVLVSPASSSFHHHHQRAADDQAYPHLSAAQCALDADAAKSADAASPGSTTAAIQFWQASQPATAGAGSADKKPLSMAGGYGSFGFGVGVGAGVGGGVTCQDCGNQSKKDCVHHRCRTCCTSKGYDCATHVKSTWVSAARRRERHQLTGGSSPPTSSAFPATTAPTKKPRLISSQTTTTTSRTSTSNATTPRSFDTSSSHQASFRDGLPRQVRAPAVFRCVRVTSIDNNGDDEFAYQASVTINGHMFKGFLYDQGAGDARALASASNVDTSHAAGVPSISDLHLGSASAVPHHDLYSGELILGGLGYGNNMN